jgi:hypothetical protein
MQTLSTEFHINLLRNVESTGLNLFPPLSKVRLTPNFTKFAVALQSYIEFHEIPTNGLFSFTRAETDRRSDGSSFHTQRSVFLCKDHPKLLHVKM